ncbi:MAG: rhodanese-like domain-containing protein [Pseudomonadota bacterium]
MQDGSARVMETGPAEAWAMLLEDPDTRMVDVRSAAEWTFVGMPDLGEAGKRIWPIEWSHFPGMMQNAQFLDQLAAMAKNDGGMPRRLLFICRSGARSMAAARTVASVAPSPVEACINVAEGFEGDLDTEGRRGRVNGWKVAGLPWRQS